MDQGFTNPACAAAWITSRCRAMGPCMQPAPAWGYRRDSKASAGPTWNTSRCRALGSRTIMPASPSTRPGSCCWSSRLPAGRSGLAVAGGALRLRPPRERRCICRAAELQQAEACRCQYTTNTLTELSPSQIVLRQKANTECASSKKGGQQRKSVPRQNCLMGLSAFPTSYYSGEPFVETWANMQSHGTPLTTAEAAVSIAATATRFLDITTQPGNDVPKCSTGLWWGPG